MPRLPHAGHQLIAEIQSLLPEARITSSDEDGFSVYRTLHWDETTEKKIGEALKVSLEHDPRVEVLRSRGVTFVSTIYADTRDEFNLAKAQAILHPTKKGRKKS